MGSVRRGQAINELHEDEDFQGDASQPRMMGVVEDARTGNLSQHAGDGAAVHVLGKLRRFQVSAGGGQPRLCPPLASVMHAQSSLSPLHVGALQPEAERSASWFCSDAQSVTLLPAILRQSCMPA